jgi:hypothetical protein
MSITHKKTNGIASWTQTDINTQIAAGNLPGGTTLSQVVISSDWNDTHTVALLPADFTTATGTPSSTTAYFGDNSWKSVSGTGTVTSVTVIPANGLSGTVATATTTPAITLSTTITGVLKGNGTAISSATAGTDYQVPISLTTTGTSGAATFASNTLNIPQYAAPVSSVSAADSSVTISPTTGAVTVALTTNTRMGTIGISYDGGGVALTTGKKNYITCPFAGTITGWNITVDTGTCTIDVWKIATGTAIPTVANTITAAALPAISTGTAIHSTILTGWTTAIAIDDIFGFNITAVTGATLITLNLEVKKT